MTTLASNISMQSATARFPFDVTLYERPTELNLSERQALGAIVGWASAGKKGWPPGVKIPLASLLHPLYDLLDHMGVTNTAKRLYTIRTSVIYEYFGVN